MMTDGVIVYKKAIVVNHKFLELGRTIQIEADFYTLKGINNRQQDFIC